MGEQRHWQVPSPSAIPQPKFQREPDPVTELACAGSVQVAQTGATPLHSESCPGRGEDKVHTSLTVAPAVGWGQTSGLTVARPPTQVTPGSTGEVPCSSVALQGLSKMMKCKNRPQKKLQEVATANELIKMI